MATVYVYYTADDSKDELCFICAIKLALTTDPSDIQIETNADNYEFHKCEVCGTFIQGQITI